MTEPAAVAPRPTGLRRVWTLWKLFRREKTDPEPFYRLLAAESAEDLDRRVGPLAGQLVVDLGCGPGHYTDAFRGLGARVIPVDSDIEELRAAGVVPEGAVVGDAAALDLADASVDGVFCSNMLEHTSDPYGVIAEIERVLRPGGWAYVSWTNWYSPWGGHEIVPYHYLGPRVGPRVHERLHGPPRKNAVGDGLYPCHIGSVLRDVRHRQALRIERVEPRYWPRLRWICKVPVLRELVTWNCVLRLRKA